MISGWQTYGRNDQIESDYLTANWLELILDVDINWYCVGTSIFLCFLWWLRWRAWISKPFLCLKEITNREPCDSKSRHLSDFPSPSAVSPLGIDQKQNLKFKKEKGKKLNKKEWWENECRPSLIFNDDWHLLWQSDFQP